ncbi:CalY family protein [Virgibacillus sp. Bac330]|uniref:CalY family protein n=1 Tax=Virgibacillus sp. Bac330 TaxID=2419841 RepID=UPI000EF55B3A|nr:CalY family protein [Virgibacillus sp. Bac330]
MGIKKQIGIGVLSATLGLTLITGGTYAYFSDEEVSQNTFAAGTLDLNAEPTEIIDLHNLKPGDSMVRTFELQNNGTLDIEKVLLETDYSVVDAKGDNTDDFGKHIEVEFLYNADKLDEVIYKTTLTDLKNMEPEAVNEHVFYPNFGEKGLPAGTLDDISVKFNFVDNGQDQNEFQGDALNLEWTFKALQGEGKTK